MAFLYVSSASGVSRLPSLPVCVRAVLLEYFEISASAALEKNEESTAKEFLAAG